MSLIAAAASSHEVSRLTTNSCGSLRWSMAQTDQSSASSQILRKCVPSTFMMQPSGSILSAPHPPGSGVELAKQLGIARFGSRDQRGVERAVGADRAGFVL